MNRQLLFYDKGDVLMKVAVIGAGASGLTAAYKLTQKDITVDVYESGQTVGGLGKTIDLWGQKVDLGPHRFFSNDIRINKLWLELAGNDYQIINRLTSIYYKNKFYFYPLKPFDALIKLGFIESGKCILSYMKEKIWTTEQDGTFENWVVSRFGRRLFEIFFKTYSEKLWGIPCKQLDADFAAQRIKNLSLFEALKNALLGGKDNKHKTLVEQFAYPCYGTGMIYERMANFINAGGGRVYCEKSVRKVIVKNKKIEAIELENGEIIKYDYVISTMPITDLIAGLQDVTEDIKAKASRLSFRNTILVYLNIQAIDLFPDNWLYIHSTDLQMGRLTNFRNWSPQLYGNEKSSILALEYWCYDREPLWAERDENLIKLAGEELRKTGLIKTAKITDGYVHRIKYCYPVYERGYREHLNSVESYLSLIEGLLVIGRYGAFKYNNQDHSILMGILAADNITDGTNHNLWKINTDYEEYQEKTIITKTGLVKT
jgi:protoporphyrinogen oxidase